MPSFINPQKLRPNPANTIFDPLPADVYAALKADIAARGLLNPILATSDFTVIAGHHRLQAALELGMDTVPVEVQDSPTPTTHSWSGCGRIPPWRRPHHTRRGRARTLVGRPRRNLPSTIPGGLPGVYAEVRHAAGRAS